MKSVKFHAIVFITTQGGETDQIQRIDSDVAKMNTISKSFIYSMEI